MTINLKNLPKRCSGDTEVILSSDDVRRSSKQIDLLKGISLANNAILKVLQEANEIEVLEETDELDRDITTSLK